MRIIPRLCLRFGYYKGFLTEWSVGNVWMEKNVRPGWHGVMLVIPWNGWVTWVFLDRTAVDTVIGG